MHIWTIENWVKHLDYYSYPYRKGLRLKFDKDVDPEVRRALKEFCKWLRQEYFFPVRIPIYVKSSEKIKALDGEMVSATFFFPISKYHEPYGRIAVGDYQKRHVSWGKDNILATYISSLSRLLTHYFQWINDIKLTEIGEERQATMYARCILDEYAEIREHP